MPIQLEVKQYSQSWFSIRWQFISAINVLREVGAERFSVHIRSLLNVGRRESASAESEKSPQTKWKLKRRTQHTDVYTKGLRDSALSRTGRTSALEKNCNLEVKSSQVEHPLLKLWSSEGGQRCFAKYEDAGVFSSLLIQLLKHRDTPVYLQLNQRRQKVDRTILKVAWLLLFPWIHLKQPLEMCRCTDKHNPSF